MKKMFKIKKPRLYSLQLNLSILECQMIIAAYIEKDPKKTGSQNVQPFLIWTIAFIALKEK